MENKECASCGDEFQPRVHNAIYCSIDCRKIATNKKILQKYHDRKKAMGQKRVCETKGCGTILSRYNDTDTCEPCKSAEFSSREKTWIKDIDK